jgi:hypothetical protein
VDVHVLSETPCALSGRDLLPSDVTGRKIDVLQTRLLCRLLDGRRRHVRRAGDLLPLQLCLDRVVPVDGEHDRDDAEGDQNGAGDDASDPKDSSSIHENPSRTPARSARRVANNVAKGPVDLILGG